MSLVETISTLGPLVFTSFLSQAKNARSEFDDEFILQPRKELYWPVTQHLLTLCNRAWARMYVCTYVWDTSSFLKPAGFHHPRTKRAIASPSSRAINSMHAGASDAYRADLSAEFRPKKRTKKIVSLRAQKTRASKKGETVLETLVKLGRTAEPRNDIQP